jgi:ubiquinone/menaquinone biosynthesis C-methylase UbiE
MKIESGSSTASPFNVQYRVGRIANYLNGGDWLDYGCAEGGYTRGLLDMGAGTASGIDVIAERIETARKMNPAIPFHIGNSEVLPFAEESFDGIFVNEVLEHVSDEEETLNELRRVLRPGGVLIVISPNRGFPFEGHTIHVGRWTSKAPTFMIPWLPRVITDHWVTARNYWPKELRQRIAACGFTVIESGFIMPGFGFYPWLPEGMASMFRRHIARIDRFPGVRRMGVSNLVVARRPGLPARSIPLTTSGSP